MNRAKENEIIQLKSLRVEIRQIKTKIRLDSARYTTLKLSFSCASFAFLTRQPLKSTAARLNSNRRKEHWENEMLREALGARNNQAENRRIYSISEVSMQERLNAIDSHRGPIQDLRLELREIRFEQERFERINFRSNDLNLNK